MNTELCVKAGSLAMDAEDGGPGATPAVGDSVEFTATGKVSRVEGDNAYVSVESVNGEPVASMPDKGMEETAEDSPEKLREDIMTSTGGY